MTAGIDAEEHRRKAEMYYALLGGLDEDGDEDGDGDGDGYARETELRQALEMPERALE